MTETPEDSPERGTGRDAAAGGPDAHRVLAAVRAEFPELTGMTIEAVSFFSRRDDGCVLRVEVVDVVRIPDAMRLPATYEVYTDPRGRIAGYQRVSRAEGHRSEEQP